MKRLHLLVLTVGILAGIARADMVVQRWGTANHTQHKDLAWQGDRQNGTLTVDLSALPRDAKIYRSRLVFTSGAGYDVTADGKALALVEPYCLWFDATEALRAAAGKGKLALNVRGEQGVKVEDAFLEIAYEGKLADPPQQITNLKAFHYHGQTFLTWKEIEDLAGGKADVSWGEMAAKVRLCNPLVGVIPKWTEREIRYSVYRHGEPITSANIAQAEFLYDVPQCSMYAENAIAKVTQGEHGPTTLKEGQVLRRVILEKNEPLPPGTGFHWTTSARAGKAYYAVLTSVNGVENAAQITAANTVGPLEETVEPPAPMLTEEKTTDLRSPAGAKWVEQWYSYWCGKPLSAFPHRYDVGVAYCPQTLEKQPALAILRDGWGAAAQLPRNPAARKDIALSQDTDLPLAFRMGPADYHYTLKSPRQSVWRPWTINRQEALIQWAARQFNIDPQRINVNMGSWGMMEIERPDLYAMIQGYGEPGFTEGFQCWDRSRGTWGPPEIYAGRPNAENPYLRSAYDRYVLADPARDTPFFNVYPNRSSHLSEMGWPPLPRFWRAMIESKHPFVVNWMVANLPEFRRDQSVPAFGNCSLDENPGVGDLRNGLGWDAHINAYLSWDSSTIVDEPDRWEMTLVMDGAAPLDECTVDLTPRKCQKFKAASGRTFKWTCTPIAGAPAESGKSKGKPGPAGKPAPAGAATPAAAPAVQSGKPSDSGEVAADKSGLVTIPALRLAKGQQRVAIFNR